MELTPEQEREANAIIRLIRATMEDPDMHTSFSVLLGFAQAIIQIEVEETQTDKRAIRWSERATVLQPRIYKLLRRSVCRHGRMN